MDEQNASINDVDRSLFPSSFTIRALRDSRYQNPGYAIAELFDNAIEAGAEQIDLLCMEKQQRVNSQLRWRVSEIAVLDNGEGMDWRTLIDALRFGGGTRHGSTSGIGKYGMGLPTSSMSQCKRVDVWTWRDGLKSVWHSSIDADNIASGDHSVPFPDQTTPIPDSWITAGSERIYEHSSGTLVLWSKLDKIQWKTGKTIIENTAREVGRIHRHFINIGLPRIRGASFYEGRPNELHDQMYVVATDPLYLMQDTSTPESPWDKEAMFTQWSQKSYPIIVDGKAATIEVKYSIVKPEALKTERLTRYPGDTDRGKHARHNIGVSVVREWREIVLEQAFLREGGSTNNPQNRWWGCEVHFTRDCDELFGVDHNKQMVANFTQAARTLARDDRPNQTILDELGIDDDIIHNIVGDIRDQIRNMMSQIGLMFKQRRPSPNPDDTNRPRNPEKKAVDTATHADREEIAAGAEKPTRTDRDRADIPPQEREIGLEDQFKRFGQSNQEARDLARMIVREGLSYQFNPVYLDGSLIFNVRSFQGVLHINLNTEHPIYDLIKHIEGRLDDSGDEDDPAYQAVVAIRLLLASWARMHDQTELDIERRRLENIAMDWGRHVEKVINYLRDKDE